MTEINIQDVVEGDVIYYQSSYVYDIFLAFEVTDYVHALLLHSTEFGYTGGDIHLYYKDERADCADIYRIN